MPRLAVVASKGGVGKTTVVVNVAGVYAQMGESVLVVDCDPQSNLTDALGVDLDGQPTLADVLRSSREPLRNAVMSTPIPNIDIIPAEQRTLQIAEREIVSERGIERLLLRQMAGFDEVYDWIIFDCPPSLQDLTLGAVVACDGVLPVLESGSDAVKGGLRVAAYVNDLREQELADPFLLPGVWTSWEARAKIMNDLAEEKLTAANFQMFSARIPYRQNVRQAREARQPLVTLWPTSEAAISFQSLADQISAEFRTLAPRAAAGGAR